MGRKAIPVGQDVPGSPCGEQEALLEGQEGSGGPPRGPEGV